MSERDDYPAGVPCWIEGLVPDLEAAKAFYGGVLGWAFRGPGRGDDEITQGTYLAERGGRAVAGLAPQPEAAATAAWMTHVRVDDLEGTAERAEQAGGRVLAGLFDVRPAGRGTVLADPTGGVVVAWEPGLRKGAGLVNAPGAWSMSRLDTTDPDTAAAFYGAVFGWTTETFRMGDSEAALFRVPGYVGGLPEQPVSREVVATMVAAQPGAPAGWSVDFWVDDVDAAVAAAERLGGAVPMPAGDTPLGRQAALADPAGVVFTVSRVAKAG